MLGTHFPSRIFKVALGLLCLASCGGVQGPGTPSPPPVDRPAPAPAPARAPAPSPLVDRAALTAAPPPSCPSNPPVDPSQLGGLCGTAFNCGPDQCLTSSDCGPKAACSCAGSTFGWSKTSFQNLCVPANCHTDADCGPGGACSATLGDGGPFYGTQGFYCRTPADTCKTDADCSDQGRMGYCAYQAAVGHWACGYTFAAG